MTVVRLAATQSFVLCSAARITCSTHRVVCGVAHRCSVLCGPTHRAHITLTILHSAPSSCCKAARWAHPTRLAHAIVCVVEVACHAFPVSDVTAVRAGATLPVSCGCCLSRDKAAHLTLRDGRAHSVRRACGKSRGVLPRPAHSERRALQIGCGTTLCALKLARYTTQGAVSALAVRVQRAGSRFVLRRPTR